MIASRWRNALAKRRRQAPRHPSSKPEPPRLALRNIRARPDSPLTTIILPFFARHLYLSGFFPFPLLFVLSNWAMICRVKATPRTSAAPLFRCSPRLSLRRTIASSRPTWQTHGPDVSFPDVSSSSTSHLRYLALLVVPLGTFALYRMSPIALDEQLPPTETPPKLKGREPGELIRAEELERHTTVDKRIWVSIQGEIWE